MPVEAATTDTPLVVDGFVYALNPDGVSVVLIGWSGEAPTGNVVIPSHISIGEDSLVVTHIGVTDEDGAVESVFAGSTVSSVKLPATIEVIAEGALAGCELLEATEPEPEPAPESKPDPQPEPSTPEPEDENPEALESEDAPLEPEPTHVPIINEVRPLLPAAYLTSTRSTQISVTAPVAVTFGDSNGYDVANPAESVTSTGYFKNNSDTPIALGGLSCVDSGASSILAAKPGSPALESQKLFGLYPNSETSKTVKFGFGSEVDNASTDRDSFVAAPDAALACTYQLDLSNAQVNTSSADNGMTVKPLASVSYTFETVPFYLQDTSTGNVFTASQVKAHAEDISVNGEASPYYAQYSAYIADDDTYTCKVNWGDGVTYDVRIIGINHDNKADGSGKAGLTFQFVNLLESSYQMNSSADTNAGGWGASELRARMNPGVDALSFGTDDNAIWDQVPLDLVSAIEPVKKDYGSTWNSTDSTVETSIDSLFLASYCEHSNSVNTEGNYKGKEWISAEGVQYEYWKGKVPNNFNAENPSMVKSMQLADSTPFVWWERTVEPGNATNFLNVYINGSLANNSYASFRFGVCPCFCL